MGNLIAALLALASRHRGFLLLAGLASSVATASPASPLPPVSLSTALVAEPFATAIFAPGSDNALLRTSLTQGSPLAFFAGAGREDILLATIGVLAATLLACLFVLLRQRTLQRRLVLQSQQIAETRAILTEAQRNAHLGIWRYDARSRYLACSDESLRIIDRKSSLGTPSYFRLLASIPTPDRALVHRALRGVLRDGIPCEITAPFRLRNGSLRILHATAQPTRNPNGHVTGLFGTLQDITRQKAAEEGLRAREQLLRALYENVPTAMGVVEEAGSSVRFVSANPSTARLLGLHNIFLANRILAELPLSAPLAEFWTAAFRQGLALRELHKAELFHEPTRRYYAITLVPLSRTSRENQHRQLCFLVDDVTERREIDAEISQGRRLRAIGELVGGIAHEFNNLLTPIMLKAELLACEWANDPRLLEELQTISRAAKRGADLTRRLLTFGRRADIRPEELNLHAVILANFDLLKTTIDRRITLVSDVPENLPPLFLNASALHQIILNLLLNARDTLVDRLNQNQDTTWEARISVQAELPGTGDGGPSARPSSSWIVLSIQDNGMGMTREVQERIFEPFYTTKEVGKGTGLGLATVWNLTSRLGGKITVESAPGRGSTFRVWLPVAVGRTAPKEPRQPADAPATASPSANILLVEDDELVSVTVVAMLKQLGHRTTHITNGSTAWRHLQQNPHYDLLLLDLNIPGISGLEIARRARAANFHGRILIASGRLGENDAREMDALHVELSLQKPFTTQALGAALQNCLGRKPVLV